MDSFHGEFNLIELIDLSLGNGLVSVHLGKEVEDDDLVLAVDLKTRGVKDASDDLLDTNGVTVHALDVTADVFGEIVFGFSDFMPNGLNSINEGGCGRNEVRALFQNRGQKLRFLLLREEF